MELSGLDWRFTSGDASTNPITRERLSIKSIRWQGCSSAAHAVVLKDVNGVERWRAESTAADFETESLLEHGPQHAWEGLVIPTLDSGTLLITLQ